MRSMNLIIIGLIAVFITIVIAAPLYMSNSIQTTVSAEKIDYTIRWWRWVLSHNESANLLEDYTGALIMKYQLYPVYFLTGSYNGTQTRSVTIPAGREILVPILNSVTSCFNCNLLNTLTIQKRLIDAQPIVNATHLESNLDGKELPFLRITSPV